MALQVSLVYTQSTIFPGAGDDLYNVPYKALSDRAWQEQVIEESLCTEAQHEERVRKLEEQAAAILGKLRD